MRVEDVPRPDPGPDQVLVRISHGGICGTDLKIYEGSIQVRYPIIMGHEMAGEIMQGGDDRLHDGDRVLIDPVLSCGNCFCCRAGLTNLCTKGGLLGRDADGGFAEYAVVPRSHVFPLPEAVDSCQAPLIQVLTTCVRAHRKIDILPGHAVAVVGLGVAGQLHVQLAKSRGADPVIGVTRSAWKRRLAERLGADLTLPSGLEAIRGVLDATGNRGAEFVIESTGALQGIADAICMTQPGGTLLLFGITTAREGALPFYQLYFKELRIVNARAALPEDFGPCINLVASGAVKLAPLITHVLPLAEARTAIEMLKTASEQRMKVILDNSSTFAHTKVPAPA